MTYSMDNTEFYYNKVFAKNSTVKRKKDYLQAE